MSSCDDRIGGQVRANTNKKSKQENVLFDQTQFVRTLNMFLSWPCLTKPPIVLWVSSCQLWFVHCGGWSGVEPYHRILVTAGSMAPPEHLIFISNWSSRLLSASVNTEIQLDVGWRPPVENMGESLLQSYSFFEMRMHLFSNCLVTQSLSQSTTL